MFADGMLFRSQSECEEYSRDKIVEGQFQWFIDIVSYLHCFTGETVFTLESQRDEVYAAKVRKMKEQSIVVSDFKMDIPPILGGLG